MRRKLSLVVGFFCCPCAATASWGGGSGLVASAVSSCSATRRSRAGFFRLTRGLLSLSAKLGRTERLHRAICTRPRGAKKPEPRSETLGQAHFGLFGTDLRVHSALYRVRRSTVDYCGLSRRKNCENSRSRGSARPPIGQLLWAGARRRPARPYQGFARCQTVAAGR